MNDSVLVSIGVPCYNYEKYIKDCLDSIAAQSYNGIEILVVDDCSTDNSVNVIAQWMEDHDGRYTIRLIKNSINLGLTKVCNIILQNSKGKYFQVLDADDLLLPGKIDKQVKLLEASPNAGFVYSNIAVMDENGDIIHPDYLKRINYNKDAMPSGNIHRQLFDFNFIPLPSVLINTVYAKEAGGFDESLQVQDYYLWLKLTEQYKAIYMNEITAIYRVHERSMSSSTLTNPKSVESVLRIKYKYYDSGDVAIRKKIKSNIYFSAAYLYQYKYPSAGYWLKKNFLLNPSIKTFAYLLAKNIGIPFSFFNWIKQRLASR